MTSRHSRALLLAVAADTHRHGTAIGQDGLLAPLVAPAVAIGVRRVPRDPVFRKAIPVRVSAYRPGHTFADPFPADDVEHPAVRRPEREPALSRLYAAHVVVAQHHVVVVI